MKPFTLETRTCTVWERQEPIRYYKAQYTEMLLLYIVCVHCSYYYSTN